MTNIAVSWRLFIRTRVVVVHCKLHFGSCSHSLQFDIATSISACCLLCMK